MRQRGDHADAQGLPNGGHDDGDRLGGGFRGPRCRRSAGHDQVDVVAHQLRDELGETLALAVGRAIVDVEVCPSTYPSSRSPLSNAASSLGSVPRGTVSRMPMA